MMYAYMTFFVVMLWIWTLRQRERRRKGVSK